MRFGAPDWFWYLTRVFRPARLMPLPRSRHLFQSHHNPVLSKRYEIFPSKIEANHFSPQCRIISHFPPLYPTMSSKVSWNDFFLCKTRSSTLLAIPGPHFRHDILRSKSRTTPYPTLSYLSLLGMTFSRQSLGRPTLLSFPTLSH